MTANHKSPDLIPAHGGYRDLKSYKMSEIVYDAAVFFRNRFIDRRSRTHGLFGAHEKTEWMC